MRHERIRLRGRFPAGGLDTVNRIAGLIGPHAFERDTRGRLYVITFLQGSRPDSIRTVRSAAYTMPTGIYPAFRYGQHGMGGTEAMAITQLIQWIRGEPRKPMSWWRYVCGPSVMLAGPEHHNPIDRRPDLLAALQASTYTAGDATVCILCGHPDPHDWWSLDGIRGPCCFHRCADGRECYQVHKDRYERTPK